MPETKLSNLDISNLENVKTDFTVEAAITDSVADQPETEWTNTNWSQYLGYYKSIPELAAAIDAKATWTVGKGFKAEPNTKLILDGIKGWGKDTFNTILENCIRTYHIGGDSFCEIIRDDDGEFINLKPLDPSTIKIIVNGQGLIKRYEQISKTRGKDRKFKKEDLFHLARNRVADEIHGVSIIPAIETIILQRNEAMADYKRLLHRNVEPIHLYHLDTDDAAEIAAFKAKADKANEKGENIYVPKGNVEHELVTTPSNATLNPLPWIEANNIYFFQATGVPQIIVGGSGGFTEAAVKIAYLAFQQTIEEEQLFVEEQILAQLNLVIELEFPASLENELLSDKKKDEENGAVQPNDTTAELEGNK